MAPKNASAVSKSPLKPADGNRRKSNRVNPTPSQKEQENIAQEQAGTMGSDELADELADTMDITEDAEHNEMPQYFKEHLQQHQELAQLIAQLVQQNKETAQQNKEIAQQNKEIIQQNKDITQELARVHQRAEELETLVHQMREERPSEQSYAGIAARGGAPPPGAFSTAPAAPRAEEFFCTIDFGHAEGGEDAVDAISVRQKIEEVRKGEDKTFKCIAVTRNFHNKQRLRIFCRSEEELEVVKRAATATVVEGARILRDQLYPVKVNNARTDAILNPDGVVKEEALAALNDSNKTNIAKLFSRELSLVNRAQKVGSCLKLKHSFTTMREEILI